LFLILLGSSQLLFSPQETYAGLGCEPGEFLDESICVPCLEGSFCTGGGDLPVACTAGSYCPAGTANPIPCDAGFFCIEGSVSAQESICPAGSFCPAGTAVPQQCPAGFFCPVGTSVPQQCPEGTTSEPGSSECEVSQSLCDGKTFTIFKDEPDNDASNIFMVNDSPVEMERWDKDGSTVIDANEGWIITGTGNRNNQLADVVEGSHLDDLITPGWGDDTVCAGDGEDTVQGGWGEDTLFGEADDDLLKGGHNNDTLIGGDGTSDEAQGGQGNSDICDAEDESKCELDP